MRNCTIVLLFCFLSLFDSGCHRAKPQPTQEEYCFAAFVDGKKMGHIVHTRHEEETRIIHTEQAQLSIRRAGTAMTVSGKDTYIETPQCEPLGFESVQYMGAFGMAVHGVKNSEDPNFTVTITTGSRRQTRIFDWPEGALMAEGIERLSKEMGLEKGTYYTTKIFTPMTLQAVDVEVEVGDQKQIDLLGRVILCTEVTATMKMGSGSLVITNYVDENCQPQKMLIPMMGMNFEMVACNREFALSENDVPEFLDRLVLVGPESLQDYPKTKQIRYHLRPHPGVGLAVVEDDNQRVTRDDPNGLIVTVRPLADPNGVSFPYQGKEEIALEALKPTRYLQSDGEQIIKLSKLVVGDTKDAAQAARKIEGFVRNYVTEKSLSIGYASAVEVATSQEGDCTEHAVLTAAMCQAVGIPARVAFGYVYCDEWAGKQNVFVGHAWTQAYIGGQWIGLDGTRGPNGYTAGHLTLAVGNGNPEDFFSLVTIQGQFEIADIEVSE